MKDIKCKCSHLESEHKKFWWKREGCTNCACNEYLKFDRPNKTDKVMFGYAVFILGIYVMTMIALLTIQVDLLPGNEKAFYEIILVTVGAMFIISGLEIFDGMILKYYKHKRRNVI